MQGLVIIAGSRIMGQQPRREEGSQFLSPTRRTLRAKANLTWKQAHNRSTSPVTLLLYLVGSVIIPVRLKVKITHYSD